MWHQCVLWKVCGEQNSITLDGVADLIIHIKKRFRLLYEWMVVLGNIPSCAVLEFLDILSLSICK